MSPEQAQEAIADGATIQLDGEGAENQQLAMLRNQLVRLIRQSTTAKFGTKMLGRWRVRWDLNP